MGYCEKIGILNDDRDYYIGSIYFKYSFSVSIVLLFKSSKTRALLHFCSTVLLYNCYISINVSNFIQIII